MTKFNNKNKHLSLNDRLEIATLLYEGASFKQIALSLKKDPSTISKEVRKHIYLRNPNYPLTDVYGNSLQSSCPKLSKAPYVCNSCKKRAYCKSQKYYYDAKKAHQDYLDMLKSSRAGIALNKEYFYELDRIITDGIKKGQHIYYIIYSNQLNVSISSIYRYIDRGYLSINNIDLPRKVKFKARKRKYLDSITKALKVGRSFDDFSKFLSENSVSNYVELDTVIGKIGGKVLLTCNFTFCNFMFGILLDNKTSASVSNAFIELKKRFLKANKSFKSIFPIILTDNGAEFSDIFSIENSLYGEKETSLFFARPMMSCDKAKIEKNHTLLRDILPKGTSFESFDQNDINIIFSHINSVRRNLYTGKTPYELFDFTYGNEITSLLGISKIPDKEVIQSPLLIQKLKNITS